MLGLKNLKSALRLLLLTFCITYTCLYTLTCVNQFRPPPLASPSPAAVKNSGSQEEFSNTARKVQSQPLPSLIPEVTKNSGNQAEDGDTTEATQQSFNDDLLLESVTKENSKEGIHDATVIENDINHEKALEKKVIKKTIKTKVNSNKRVWPITLKPSNASALRHIDFSKYSAKNQKTLKTHLKVLEERAKVVGRVCEEQPRHLHTASGANHLVWDTQHDPNIVWCPNYKVASTSMMMSFMRVSPRNPDLQSKHRVKQGEVRDLYWRPKTGKERAMVLKNSVRVIIVRHPFTRILSAYRDKMTKLKPGPIKFEFRKLQKKIIAHYRPVNSSIDSSFPTFPEFIQYVIDETEGLTSTEDWREKVRCWVTYWAHCNVCTTDYSIIMKLETMEEDKKFLVTLSNLKELKKASSDEWLHLKNATSRDLAPQFYSQLTRDQILQLYDHYKLDFDLFGYGIDDYLALV